MQYIQKSAVLPDFALVHRYALMQAMQAIQD
jgi:hypothetical protein